MTYSGNNENSLLNTATKGSNVIGFWKTIANRIFEVFTNTN